ncbi:PREDICTED: uncharacterized protein LOC109208598 [Nicotiana attenuata]|uniref:uncharacterized protein LOC109208598 n=1 Tax=Nicotiana attenuata TaxID=49451 RepID=UPI000905D460|nr:PREDICTED: uncharacterized protein LOC109208598 [Nicotiana attenuata]
MQLVYIVMHRDRCLDIVSARKRFMGMAGWPSRSQGFFCDHEEEGFGQNMDLIRNLAHFSHFSLGLADFGSSWRGDFRHLLKGISLMVIWCKGATIEGTLR